MRINKKVNGRKELIISLYDEGKSYKEIEILADCCHSTVTYHVRNRNTKDNRIIDKEKTDKINVYRLEGLTIAQISKLMGISKTSVANHATVKKKRSKSLRDKKNSKYRDIKQQCVDYKGGRCSICGYDKCLRSLQFHHVNPEEKDFGISHKTSFEVKKAELDKCILVCANCHGEIHSSLEKDKDDKERAMLKNYNKIK